MNERQAIPIILTFSGVVTYLVETASIESATHLAEKQFKIQYPDTELESVFVLDQSEVNAIILKKRKYFEIVENPDPPHESKKA
jgi:hypothetical protein